MKRNVGPLWAHRVKTVQEEYCAQDSFAFAKPICLSASTSCNYLLSLFFNSTLLSQGDFCKLLPIFQRLSLIPYSHYCMAIYHSLTWEVGKRVNFYTCDYGFVSKISLIINPFVIYLFCLVMFHKFLFFLFRLYSVSANCALASAFWLMSSASLYTC